MKRFFGNLIDILCLTSCGIFACIVTKTVPTLPDVLAIPQDHLIGMGVTLLLLLIFRRLTKMVWNTIFCVATIVLIAALLEWGTEGTLIPPVLQSMVTPYTIPTMLESGSYYELGSFALLWLMGALCCHGFWRVIKTAVGCYAMWLILALLLHCAAKLWFNMDNAPLAELQPALREYICVTAAFPGCLLLCYAVLMSMFDALFMGWPTKENKLKEKVAAETQTTPAAVKPVAKPVAKAALKPVVKVAAKAPVAVAPAPAPVPAEAPAKKEETPAPAPKA